MQRQHRSRPLLASLALAFILPLAGCGDDDTGPAESPLVLGLAPTKSGDDQNGTAGEALDSPLRVIVTRDGTPIENVEIEWRASNGGSMAPARSGTDAEGVAESVWTLGPAAGAQTASALLSGAEGSPVAFSATALEPEPPAGVTVQVLTEGGNRFEPADITIGVGQAVTWVWPEGSIGHNVVPTGDEPAPSGPLQSGPATYSFTFTEPGTYAYYCAAHGTQLGTGMAGTVTVATQLP